MVEKKSAISYESIMKDLKARKYSPVYVLMGEEPFYIDKICDYISENVLQPEERDFTQTVGSCLRIYPEGSTCRTVEDSRDIKTMITE